MQETDFIEHKKHVSNFQLNMYWGVYWIATRTLSILQEQNYNNYLK